MIFLSAPFLIKSWAGIVFLTFVVVCIAPAAIRDARQARTWRERLEAVRIVLVLLVAIGVLVLLRYLTEH